MECFGPSFEAKIFSSLVMVLALVLVLLQMIFLISVDSKLTFRLLFSEHCLIRFGIFGSFELYDQTEIQKLRK